MIHWCADETVMLVTFIGMMRIWWFRVEIFVRRICGGL